MESNKNIRKYRKTECVAFRSTKEHFGGLSNMAGGYPIRIKEHWIYNAEALYQAFKYPNHPNIQLRIFEMKSPIFAKNVSRKYKKNERSDWNKVRFKIMRFCLELKLQNNFDRFSAELLSTGNKPIVEFTNKDKVWGAIAVDEFYEGTNALGRLLMELREKVKLLSEPYIAEPPDIDDLIILNINLKK